MIKTVKVTNSKTILALNTDETAENDHNDKTDEAVLVHSKLDEAKTGISNTF